MKEKEDPESRIAGKRYFLMVKVTQGFILGALQQDLERRFCALPGALPTAELAAERLSDFPWRLSVGMSNTG
jgi:hypothetical protein